jgi:hypothetical protein
MDGRSLSGLACDLEPVRCAAKRMDEHIFVVQKVRIQLFTINSMQMSRWMLVRWFVNGPNGNGIPIKNTVRDNFVP